MRVQVLEKQGAQTDPQQGKRQHEPQKALVQIVTKCRHAQDIHDEQDRHQDGRCLRHRDRQGHHGHRQRAQARTKATFADAQQKDGRHRNQVEKGSVLKDRSTAALSGQPS